jgi:hypothetical protein
LRPAFRIPRRLALSCRETSFQTRLQALQDRCQHPANRYARIACRPLPLFCRHAAFRGQAEFQLCVKPHALYASALTDDGDDASRTSDGATPGGRTTRDAGASTNNEDATTTDGPTGLHTTSNGPTTSHDPSPTSTALPSSGARPACNATDNASSGNNAICGGSATRDGDGGGPWPSLPVCSA